MPNVLAAIAAFGAMIFFHELGHFFVAKRAGVRVHAFAMGFGPKILGWRRGETSYSLNLLPFGGYVRMEGEDDGADGAGSFRAKSIGARMGIIVAGPLMNLLSAVFILTLVAALLGEPTRFSARVGTLEAGWPAAEAGLKSGDEIVAINGEPVTSGEQVIETIHQSAGKPLTLKIRRSQQEFEVTVTPRLDAKQGFGRIGFQPQAILTRVGPVEALMFGFERTWVYVTSLVPAVRNLIREGRFFESLGGPVAAGSVLAQTAAIGLYEFLHVAAFLSVMIGIFNLLPVPALDGGRLAFLIVERLRGRPIDPRQEGLIHTVGFALLLLLIVGLTFRDIMRLLGLHG